MKLISLLTAISTLFCCGTKEETIKKIFSSSKAKYALIVSKKGFILNVYDREMNQAASYKIGYGKNPDKKSKQFEGDNRTPEGIYYVTEILSMDADKKRSPYKKLASMNKIFFRARDGHSKFGKESEDIGDNAYGPRFYALNYPNDADQKRYAQAVKSGAMQPVKGKIPGIGFGIAIHGNNDEIGIGELSSSGCVRLYNNDIIELDQYIEIGTPVYITSERD